MADTYGLAVQIGEGAKHFVDTIHTLDVRDNLSRIYESLDIALPSDVSQLCIKVA